MMRKALLSLLALFAFFGGAFAAPPTFDTIERRAFDFFWAETDHTTGLTKDRATDIGSVPSHYTVASIASTGYALAALPIGVSHGWVSKSGAYTRALTTLRFLHDRLPQNHGFYYHFVDADTGERVWKCELSSCDTALLVLGALAAGDYWPKTDVQRLAVDIADRVDWQWMQTEGGATPDALAPSMGWKPESGWLASRWQGYSEAAYVYWLGMGSGDPAHRMSPAAWNAWIVTPSPKAGKSFLGEPSPLFMAQMAAGYFDVRNQRDRQGREWWTGWTDAHLVDQSYYNRHPKNRTYAAGFWGGSASDTPDGYGVQSPIDGRNDGTVSPSAMLAALPFTPERAQQAVANLWLLRDRLWGRYGFVDAFNLQRNWYDRDVIGIDLGMMLLLIENARTGLIWRLLRTDPTVRRGLKAAGFGTQTTQAIPY